MDWFRGLALRVAQAAGSPAAFGTAVTLILGWLAAGPALHFSDTWQLIANTGTTLVTFLMVFLVQATQNRDSAALHVKLDELIAAVDGADNRVIDAERLDDAGLARIWERINEKQRRAGAGQVEEEGRWP